MFGKRPLPTVDRSLDRKIATDAFGSMACVPPMAINGGDAVET
jgi:hypothetical protein